MLIRKLSAKQIIFYTFCALITSSLEYIFIEWLLFRNAIKTINTHFDVSMYTIFTMITFIKETCCCPNYHIKSKTKPITSIWFNSSFFWSYITFIFGFLWQKCSTTTFLIILVSNDAVGRCRINYQRFYGCYWHENSFIFLQPNLSVCS